MKKEIKLRIVLWGVFFLFLLFLFYKALSPFGNTGYVYQGDNEFISDMRPETRVNIKNDFQEIIGEPIYFSLRTSRKFDNALLEFDYKNNNKNIPVLEAGVLVDSVVWQHKMQNIENKHIDEIAASWEKIIGDNVFLFIRPGFNASSSYDNLISFEDNLPSIDEIAVYNYDLNYNYSIDSYSSSSEYFVVESDLRGPYQFYTYIKKEDLDFSFIFKDLNSNKDPDPVVINLYYREFLIDTFRLDDDGISEDIQEESEERNLLVRLPNLPEGVYKIELRVNNDIITESIRTKQNKLSFLNKVWLASSSENILLNTDSRMILAQTTNPESVQNIAIGSTTLEVKETFKQFSGLRKGSSTKMILEKGDIIIAGDGLFSFSEESLFDPKLKKVDRNFNPDQFNYIMSSYEGNKDSSEWRHAKIEFDLNEAYRENSKYGFMISAPGLRADDNIEDSIEIKNLKIHLEGKTLFEKIKDILN